MSDKCKVFFLSYPQGEELGWAILPFSAINQLEVGDVIRFKDAGRIYGPGEIVAFAINEGFPEGTISVKMYDDIKGKASIKLKEVNDEALDKRLPF